MSRTKNKIKKAAWFGVVVNTFFAVILLIGGEMAWAIGAAIIMIIWLILVLTN